MKKFTKMISLLLALLLVAASFAACSNTAVEETSAADETAAEEETVAEDETTAGLTTEFAGKTLIMGSSCDFPPYESVGENGEYVGIDVDIATAVCEKLGATLEIKDMDFNGIIAAVEAKAVDFGMSGMTITEKRKESVNFCTPYESAVQVILVKEGSDITSKEDLTGKTIGVQAGTTGDSFCTEDFGADYVKQYQKYSLAIQALVNDQVDCVVLDSAPAKEFQKENEGLVVLDTAYGTEEYACAFNKEDTALLEAFNAALAELTEEGVLDDIFAKYKTEEEVADDAAVEETIDEAVEETVEETEEAAA